MILPCDAVLCFYLLLGQRHIVDNSPSFNKQQVWFAKQELITNDNIFDLNEITTNLIIDDKQ